MSTAAPMPQTGTVIDLSSCRGTVVDLTKTTTALPDTRSKAKRSAARWSRRQVTADGGVPRIVRGGMRIAAWVIGAEGEQATAARRHARAATRDARHAARRAHLAVRDLDTKRRSSALAKQEAEMALVAADRASKRARIAMGVRASLVAGPLAIADIAAYGVADGWGLAGATAATLLGLARAGRQRRHDDELMVIEGEVVTSEDPQPTGQAEVLTAAFRSEKLIKADQEIRLAMEPTRDHELGITSMELILPAELNADDVIDKAKKVAAGLDRPVATVHLQKIPDASDKRIMLHVFDHDPFGEAAKPSPLLANPQRTDVKAGIPIGHTRYGQTVHIKLWHVMGLLGGTSRTGKGMLLRNIICGLGLDPRVNLRLVAGAKPGEHRGYGPVCATFFGRRPQRLVALLDVFLAEARRREEYLEDEGRAKLGEKDLDRFPLEVLIIDEYKQYADCTERVPDPSEPDKTVKAADRIAEQVAEAAAFVAALNMVVLISTQDPDANTIPRGFKNNAGARVSTRTLGATQTNAILRDGATGNGLRAHDIPQDRKGCAIVDIDGAPGEFIRGFFVEDEEYDGAEPIIQAGVELRQQLGRMPGQFADPIEARLLAKTGESSVAGGPTGSGRPGRPEDAEPEPACILDLLHEAVPEGADRVSMADVRGYLSAHDSGQWGQREGESDAAYAGRFGKALAEAFEAAGTDLVVRQSVRFADGSRSAGLLREDIEAARNAR